MDANEFSVTACRLRQQQRQKVDTKLADVVGLAEDSIGAPRSVVERLWVVRVQQDRVVEIDFRVTMAVLYRIQVFRSFSTDSKEMKLTGLVIMSMWIFPLIIKILFGLRSDCCRHEH